MLNVNRNRSPVLTTKFIRSHLLPLPIKADSKLLSPIFGRRTFARCEMKKIKIKNYSVRIGIHTAWLACCCLEPDDMLPASAGLCEAIGRVSLGLR